MKRYRATPEYYDAEYAHEPMLAQDVPFLLDHLPPRQRILELAVGTGRVAIPLAQAGHRVVGVDHDRKMLDIARRKRDSVGLGERELELIPADLLHLDLRRRFDWVVILFNTFLLFTTIEQQDQALAVVRKHLRPRGRFWLDIFHPDLALLARGVSTNLDPVVFYIPELDRTVFRHTELRPDPARQLSHIIYHYTWFDAQGQEHQQRREFELAFVFPRETRLLLERNGFTIEHLYGNYDGSGLKADSPRMIACCRAS